MSTGTDQNNPYAFDGNSRSGTDQEVVEASLSQVPSNPPAVRFWVQVYNVCMVLLYLLVAAIGISILLFANELAEIDEGDEFPVALIGPLYSILGFVFAIIFAIGLVWRRGNGAWVYQIVLISIGMTSCVTWPATIPLLIYWIRDRQRIIGQ